MDNYTEQILKAKPPMKYNLMMAGAIAVTAVGVFFLFCVSGTLGITLIVVGAFLIALAVNLRNYEYEYAFTNGDCDIARIVNRSSRKDVYSFDEGDVLRVVPYTSEKFQNEMQVNDKLAIRDFTSGDKAHEDAWYAFLISRNDVTTAVLLELNKKSVQHVKKALKSKAEF